MSPTTASVAPSASSLTGPVEGGARYRVFLSYSHADTGWARWLMRRLETYRVPRRFQGRAAPIGLVGPRIVPVFRDRDELPTTSSLGDTIRAALQESATLVVICSPAAARSRWVEQEITEFKRLHGERRVFAFIVDGEPKAEGTADDCFSPALRREIGVDGRLSAVPAEVVAADARSAGDGRKLAFLRLVAGLLHVGFDQLRQRELQRRNRRLTLVAICSVAGMALTLGLAAVAWRARNDAQRRQDRAEDVLAFMLTDFRDDLKKVGQLRVLEKVGDKAMAYFDLADPRDLTDTALARQSKALTQIGDVRMQQAKFNEAEKAFKTAYDRASALARRHPENADMLFERAQAEFWMGYVARSRGDTNLARGWITRYRDSATRLVALEPQVPRGRRELISGNHNLAVLEFDTANYAAARPAFLAEQASVEAMLASQPKNLELRLGLSDIASWLGLIAERCGDYSEAAARLAESSARVKELVELEPANSRWRLKYADSVSLAANVDALVGRRDEAVAAQSRAAALFATLLALDPKNQQWRIRSAIVRLNHAALLLADGKVGEAAGMARWAHHEVEQLVAAEPSSQAFARALAKSWRFEASLRIAEGRTDAAEAVGRAIDLGEKMIRARNKDESIFFELAQANILAGRISQARGADDVARRHWLRALEIVDGRTDVDHWRYLDSAAQALALLGRNTDAAPLIARLRSFGYHSLDPLAASVLDAAPITVSATNIR
jgi:eukaryotic-like serine/threonine-protein kinase